MTLGKRIKDCRKNAGMSQEKVAALIGVSRQAVAKWEAGQSFPNTENLFKLAEIFDTTVDILLHANDDSSQIFTEQIYSLYKIEEEKKAVEQKNKIRKNIASALWILFGYLAIYLIGRLIWCGSSENSFMGWLISAKPSGNSSYLYGWLLSSRLFWVTAMVSVVPAFFGKHRFCCTTWTAFIIGLILGIWFGPNPKGAAYGQSDLGWAIWGGIFIFSMIMGIILEKFKKENFAPKSRKLWIWAALFFVGIAALVLLIRMSIPAAYRN